MEIRFESIAVQNGLTWKTLKFKFSKRGLVLIRGVNASGKSNIRELLSHIFFNKTEKSGKANDIISRSIGKNFKGTVVLSRREPDGWVKYKVVCCRKFKGSPTGVQIWRAGTKDPITPVKKPAQAQKMAEEILGMSYEEFQAVVSLGHESVHPLIDGTDTSRADYIAKTFDLEYDHYLKATTDRLKEVNIKLAERDDNASQLKAWQGQLKDMKSPEYIKKSLVSLDERIEESKYGIEDIETKTRTLDRRMVGQKRREKILKDSVPASEVSGSSIEIANLVVSAESDVVKMENFVEEWEYIRDQEGEREAVQDSIDDTKGVKFSPQRLEKAEKRLAGLESKLDMQSDISGGGDCPTCGQDTSDVAISEAQLKALGSDIIGAEETVSKLKKNRRIVDVRRDNVETLKEIDSILSAKKPLISFKKAKKGLIKAEDRLQELEEEKTLALRRETQLSELKGLPKGSWKKTRTKLALVQVEKGKVIANDRALRSKRDLIKEAQRQYAKVSGAILSLEKKVKDADAMADERDLLVGLVAAFGRNGLKRDRVREILELIADHLHSYTKVLLPKYDFQLIDNEKKTSFISIDTENDTEGDVRSFSKGEKKRLSIALMKTERDIRKIKTNIVFLDEFDGGLDKKGISELMEVLAELKTDYESVFAITHNSDIKNFEGFDRKYEVSKTNSFSVLNTIKTR